MPGATGWATRSGAAPSDLVREMYLAVHEGTPLWQLPMQVTDHPSSGPVVHGPFAAADCSAVILSWFDAELLDCVALAWIDIDTDTAAHPRKVARAERPRHSEQPVVLDRAAARSLLADVSRWTTDGPDAGVDVVVSRATGDMTFADWFDRLDGLPAPLITA